MDLTIKPVNYGHHISFWERSKHSNVFFTKSQTDRLINNPVLLHRRGKKSQNVSLLKKSFQKQKQILLNHEKTEKYIFNFQTIP